jgi:hypothetical protein
MLPVGVALSSVALANGDGEALRRGGGVLRGQMPDCGGAIRQQAFVQLSLVKGQALIPMEPARAMNRKSIPPGGMTTVGGFAVAFGYGE